MINLEDIHSLTDFKRNAKDYVEKVKTTKIPLVLTVNGEASVVVQEALTFQAMLDRLRLLEEELRQLKLEILKKEIHLGVEQLRNGEYSEYDEESLSTLIEEIQSRGRDLLDTKESP